MRAFNAGLEMDMMSHAYDRHLQELVEEGKVSMAQIDESVRRVLRLKFRLGLFERPYTPLTTEKERFFRPQSRATAGELAAESMVLLKNANGVLPLTNVKKIAVVGPMAKNGWDLLGSWCGHGKDTDVEMLYNGLAAEFKDKAELRYAAGCKQDGDDRSGFAEAVEAARWSDVVVLCLGEKMTWSGENASRSTIALPTIQEALAVALKEAGKPIVLVLSNGRPLELNRLELSAMPCLKSGNRASTGHAQRQAFYPGASIRPGSWLLPSLIQQDKFRSITIAGRADAGIKDSIRT